MIPKVFVIKTVWDTYLCVDSSNKKIVHRAQISGSDAYVPVYGFIPSSRDDRLYIICNSPMEAQSDPATFMLDALAYDGQIKSFSILKTDTPGLFALEDPALNVIMAAEPPAHAEGDGRILVNRPAIGPWEVFSLCTVEDVPPHVAKMALDLDTLDPYNDNLCDLIDRSSNLPTGYDALQAVGRFARTEELEILAAAVKKRGFGLSPLVDTPNSDVWARAGLERLIKWLGSPRVSAEQKQLIAVDLDRLEHSDATGRLPTLSGGLTAALRRNSAPDRRFCIVATARNEGLYLPEWLAHHQVLGCEKFFIYTNNNDDSSDALLNTLADHNEITLIRNEVSPGVSPQYKAYNHALQILPDILDFKWCAIIDLDEYISFDTAKHESFAAFLDWHDGKGSDSIGLCWSIHGPSGQRRRNDAPVATRFNTRRPSVDLLTKSVFKPNKFSYTSCHGPYDDLAHPRVFVAADGTHVSSGSYSGSPTMDNAWVKHYFYKSIEEFMVRRIRNRGHVAVTSGESLDLIKTVHCQDLLDAFMAADYVTDVSLQKLAPDIATNYARVIGLSGVSHAIAQCEARFEEESRRVLDLLRKDGRFSEHGTPENVILNLLVS